MRYLPANREKSSESAVLQTGKIIPQSLPDRKRNDWNAAASTIVLLPKQTREKVMYIGLGGILVLILILWLLGVI